MKSPKVPNTIFVPALDFGTHESVIGRNASVTMSAEFFDSQKGAELCLDEIFQQNAEQLKNVKPKIYEYERIDECENIEKNLLSLKQKNGSPED